MDHADAVKVVLCALQADGGSCPKCTEDVMGTARRLWPDVDWAVAEREAYEIDRADPLGTLPPEDDE